MAFKSEAQRRKFGEMVKEGTLKQSTFDEWSAATGKSKLPERVTPAPKRSNSPHIAWAEKPTRAKKASK